MNINKNKNQVGEDEASRKKTVFAHDISDALFSKFKQAST